MKNKKIIPQHVAIIMDGNRRWARDKGLPAFAGHKYMVDHGVKAVVEGAIDLGIKYITMWAFSTENWNRDKKEVEGLMSLFRTLFNKQAGELHEKGVRIETIGDMTRFAPDIQKSVAEWKEKTKENKTITAVFALNYGGRDEIMRGMTQFLADIQSGEAKPEKKLSSKKFESYLDTAEMPPVDLIIRPGGEKRLSGFLIWQSEYAELYFSEVMMPDFNQAELKKAVNEFTRRQRRFGE